MASNELFALITIDQMNRIFYLLFNIIRIGAIFGLTLYIIYTILFKQKKPENKPEFLVNFVEILVIISIIFLLMIGDPNWATLFLTIGLLIVTLAYTITNQMNLELIKNERKSRIYKDMALNIYSPIHYIMKETNENLLTGYVIVKWINNQSFPIEERISIIQSPNDLLHKQVHDPDKILSKYINEIKIIFDGYDKTSKELEITLKKIDEKRKSIWEQFEKFCRGLKKDPISFQSGDLESIFGLVISNPKVNLKRYLNFLFFEENREVLLLKLHEMSFDEEIAEYQRIKALFITLQKGYDPIMKCLLNDWQKEYDLIESDVMRKSQWI